TSNSGFNPNNPGAIMIQRAINLRKKQKTGTDFSVPRKPFTFSEATGSGQSCLSPFFAFFAPPEISPDVGQAPSLRRIPCPPKPDGQRRANPPLNHPASLPLTPSPPHPSHKPHSPAPSAQSPSPPPPHSRSRTSPQPTSPSPSSQAPHGA